MLSFNAKQSAGNPAPPALRLGRDKKDDVRAVLEALTTTIEEINNRLSYEGPGRGGQSGEYLQKINSSLQYTYQALNELKKKQAELGAEFGNVGAFISKSITEAMQSFMNETRKIMQAADLSGSQALQGSADQNQVMQIVLGFEKRLQQLIILHTEEAELFKKQNIYLQRRLDAIDDKLAAISPNRR